MAQVSGIEVRFSGDTTSLERAVVKAEGALGNFSKAADAAVPSSFGNKLQMASYQVQDFVSQVSMGTPAARALGQQLPQLLSGFGTFATVLGTVAAIAIPLAGAFLSDADAVGKLGGTIQTIAPYAATAVAALAGFYSASMLSGIASTTTAIGTGLVGAIKAVTAAMMANPMALLVAGVAAAAVAIFAFRDDIKQVFGVDFVGVIKDSVDWTIDKFVKLAKTFSKVWGSVGDIVGNAVVGAANWAVQGVLSLVQKAIDAVNWMVDQANKIPGVNLDPFAPLAPENLVIPNSYKANAEKVYSEIGAIWGEKAGTGYVDAMTSVISGAVSKAAGLFSGFGASADAASGGKKDKADPTSVAPSQEPGTYFTDRLKQIQDQFKSERELLTEEYTLNQQVLDNALANKLIKEQEYYDLSQKLAQDHEAALGAIQQSRLDSDLAAASSFFGSMASVAQAGGKRMIKVAKAMAAAQAIIATIQAAVDAMKNPLLIDPASKMAAYAAVFAKGMSAVAAIKGVSDSGGGGSGGGGGGGGGGRTMAGAAAGGGGAAAPSPTTTFSFTLMNDPMGFGEKFARQFIDQLNSTQRNGGQIRGVIA